MYHNHTRLLKGAQLAIRLSHDTAAVIYVTAVEETWPTKTPPSLPPLRASRRPKLRSPCPAFCSSAFGGLDHSWIKGVTCKRWGQRERRAGAPSLASPLFSILALTLTVCALTCPCSCLPARSSFVVA